MTATKPVFTAMKTASLACGHHDFIPNDSEHITESDVINLHGAPSITLPDNVSGHPVRPSRFLIFSSRKKRAC